VTSGSAPESAAPAEEGDPFGFMPMQISVDPIPDAGPAITRWSVRFAPRASLLAKANDPFPHPAGAEDARRGRNCGRCVPYSPAYRHGSGRSLSAWTITLAGEAERAKIEEVFEFVCDDSDVSIEKIEETSQVEAEDNAFAALMSEGIEALHASAADTPASATAETALQLVETEEYVGPDRRSKSPTDERQEGQAAAGSDVSVKQTIRVDLDKVDRLVNLVGELVITQAMLCQGVSDAVALKQDSLVANGLSELEHLTRELQESVMAIRTQPVKSVFQRMPRLVRELGNQTSKQVRLVVDGEGTEVDKTGHRAP
jgi:two-component system chemotaxis sensor kinase CheA